MNLDVEDLLRSGMERLTDQVQAPQGLAGRAVAAHRRHRRRRTAAAVAGATVAVATAFVVAVTGAGLARRAPEPAGRACTRSATCSTASSAR